MVAVALLRRPSTWEDFMDLTDKALENGAYTRPCVKALRLGCVALRQSWFEEGLRPLYIKNTIVSFLTNTIAPSLVEFLTDDEIIDKKHEKAKEDEGTYRKHTKKIKKHLDMIAEACEQSMDRKVTPEFERMRAAMKFMATNEDTRFAFQILFVSHETARKVLAMMLVRLVEALANHNDIMTSSDIPFEAMMIKA